MIFTATMTTVRPTPNELKKHRILRNIRNNDKIIVLTPDKGNGVVIMDRQICINSCNVINNASKFKPLTQDPTISREARLQRFLRKLKKNNSINEQTYKDMFSRGSQPARLYGLPKLHKLRNPNDTPPVRPIVSSMKSYNYNLAKYLSTLLSPLIPKEHATKDPLLLLMIFYPLTQITLHTRTGTNGTGLTTTATLSLCFIADTLMTYFVLLMTKLKLCYFLTTSINSTTT